MTAPVPIRIPLVIEDPTYCEHCDCDTHVAVIDGDRLCQSCADAWVRGQAPDNDYDGHAPDEDEVADLRRSLRTAGPYRAAAIEGRLYEMGEG
jgi:hypothetical protein